MPARIIARAGHAGRQGRRSQALREHSTEPIITEAFLLNCGTNSILPCWQSKVEKQTEWHAIWYKNQTDNRTALGMALLYRRDLQRTSHFQMLALPQTAEWIWQSCILLLPFTTRDHSCLPFTTVMRMARNCILSPFSLEVLFLQLLTKLMSFQAGSKLAAVLLSIWKLPMQSQTHSQ